VVQVSAGRYQFAARRVKRERGHARRARTPRLPPQR